MNFLFGEKVQIRVIKGPTRLGNTLNQFFETKKLRTNFTHFGIEISDLEIQITNILFADDLVVSEKQNLVKVT